MARFKVGDRVKKVAHSNPQMKHRIPLGTQGTIATNWSLKRHYRIDWDGYPPHPNKHWSAFDWQLAPLTDPGVDQFMARIQQWTPLVAPPTHLPIKTIA